LGPPPLAESQSGARGKEITGGDRYPAPNAAVRTSRPGRFRVPS
jgi:hypothetical protein